MTDFNDVEEFQPEPWSDYDLIFDEKQMTFSDENKTYKLVEIDYIVK